MGVQQLLYIGKNLKMCIRDRRAQSATWTVTGCGAVVLGKNKTRVAVTGITTGKLVDMGTKDSMNMGAAMAPAAWNTIRQNFEDFGVDASYYCLLYTSVWHRLHLHIPRHPYKNGTPSLP